MLITEDLKHPKQSYNNIKVISAFISHTLSYIRTRAFIFKAMIHLPIINSFKKHFTIHARFFFCCCHNLPLFFLKKRAILQAFFHFFACNFVLFGNCVADDIVVVIIIVMLTPSHRSTRLTCTHMSVSWSVYSPSHTNTLQQIPSQKIIWKKIFITATRPPHPSHPSHSPQLPSPSPPPPPSAHHL